MATVYIDDVIATRLKFIAKCWSLRQQKIKVTQEDVLSAFVSYASQDRNRVAMIVQGMQKARPDMEVVSITGIIFTREEETVVAQCSILVEMKVDSITVI